MSDVFTYMKTIKVNLNVGKYDMHGLYGSLKLIFFWVGHTT